MISCKTITAIFLGATLCMAQTINISGIVQDTAGVGISGAMVKLEKANISTTTDAGGIFTLTGSVTLTKPFIKYSTTAASPVQLRNGKIAFILSENAPVAISIHDVAGRQIFSSKRAYGSGTHTINVPMQSAGIFLCNVTIGNEAYSFRSSSFGTSSTERTVVSSGTFTLAKQAKSAAVFADAIFIAKEGKLDYRDSIKTSDTTGIVVKMLPNAGDVADSDGNVYQSVRIGNQVWTVENLRTTKYNDGTAIPQVTDGAQWANLSTPGYCWYNNRIDTTENQKWGALYNWYAVNTGKLAPEGWRVPTDAEWDTLQNYLIANGYDCDGTTSGNKIAKAMAAQTDWRSWTVAGTIGNDLSKNNVSGFSALPAGSRGLDGDFGYQSGYSYWWSATETDASSAWDRDLLCNYERLCRYNYDKGCGFSVRLLRD